MNDILAKVIPFGRENAISRAKLAERIQLSDRSMREAISNARRDGLIIINDQTPAGGYYQTNDVADMKRQLRQIHNRAMSLLAQEKHLRHRIKAIEENEQQSKEN